jgi:membrane carboxypeptidase/penicillin-binding protein
VNTYHFAAAKEMSYVTPLQVANYTAAIANGGTLYQPHLVSRILDSSNNVVKEIPPVVIRSDFISAENYAHRARGHAPDGNRGQRSFFEDPAGSVGRQDRYCPVVEQKSASCLVYRLCAF